MALASTFSIDLAHQRGHQHWKCVLTNWGNFGTGLDAESRQYGITRPVIGVQIAPESEVGEAFIDFNDGTVQIVSNKAVPSLGPDRPLFNTLYCRRGQPYFFRTPSPIVVQATQMTQWGDTFRPTPAATNDTTAPFGQTLNGTQWPDNFPTLTLLVFFEHDPVIVACPSWPFEHEDNGAGEQFNHTNEALVRVWPIQHRNRVRVIAENYSDTDAVEVRLTGIRNRAYLTTRNYLREFELFSTPFVVAANSRIMIPVRHPEATYLLTYGRKQTNAGGASIIRFHCYAD